MKYKDYKFWWIRRNDMGYITEAAIRFYEGHYKNVEVIDINKKKRVVNQYIRTKKLNKLDLKDLNTKFTKDINNKDAILYNQDDFGLIKTDDELREFLNKQLDRIGGRKAIAEQKWTG